MPRSFKRPLERLTDDDLSGRSLRREMDRVFDESESVSPM